MKIVFHPEAYEEMLESARFYEERDEGLGLQVSSGSRRHNYAHPGVPASGSG